MTASLEVRAGYQATRTVPIHSTVFNIGRGAPNDLSLSCGEVSRKHAVILTEHDKVFVEDRGSRLGTLVNDVRLERDQRRELQPGDRIHLGRLNGVDLVFLGPHEPQARLSASSVGEVRVVRALLEGLRVLGTARLLDDVLAAVLGAALEVSGAERGFIMLAGSDRELTTKLGLTRDGRRLESGALTSRRIPRDVFATGSQRFEPDLEFDPARSRHSHTRGLKIRNVLCLPLRLMRVQEHRAEGEEEQRIGVLYLDSRTSGTLASETARATLQALADEAARAIENARLYAAHCEKVRLEQEIAVAADIQRAILPEADFSRQDVELAGVMIPCRAIGGDFYDYDIEPLGALRFCLGDVAGKGPPAALLSARVQAFLAAGGATLGVAPTVARVNELLVHRAVPGRFVTLAYASLTPAGELSYCNAGHNPPLVLRCGDVVRLDVGGPPLGLFSGVAYEEGALQLAPGDVVVVFSDGVTEASSPSGEEYGEARLISAARDLAGLAPRAVVQGILASVRAFVETSAQSDDITVLAIRYLGTRSAARAPDSP
jgi:serine phosphatase RsbU (regulator of sigma subunit)/pSer/pThr/pTyr-binding forkhead associated (FHA) protein